MKTQIVFLMLLLASAFSCTNLEQVSPSQIINSQNKSSNLRTAVIDPLATPSGWTLKQTNGNVRCFQKNNTSHYVIAVNLAKGGKLSFLYDTPSPSSASINSPNPSFGTGSINYWWNKDVTNFAVTNASFFNFGYSSQYLNSTTLPYVLKRSGSILASGSNIFDANQRWLENVGTYVTITDGPALPSSTSPLYTLSNNYYLGSNNVIGGLHPLNANKSKTVSTGRTMLGIRDSDGDGKKETVYILTTTSATQQVAYDILRNDFLSDQTIMFDGSGSSQMICNANEYTKSIDYGNSASTGYLRRSFPVAFAVRASN